MLAEIRKYSRSWLVKGLFGILIASFAAWGVDDMIRVVQRDTGAAVRVGDAEVGAAEVANQVRREINRLRPTFGGQFGIEEARTLGVVESVVQRIANDTAILVAARRHGVAVSDKLVVDAVQKTSAFQGLGGFDRNRFQLVLQQNDMTENWYLDQLRKQMVRDQLLDSIALTAAPAAMVDPIYRRRHERRVAETVFFADDAQKAVSEPDAAAIEAYHKAHVARFTAPEYRALTVIGLDIADLARETAVSDAQIREAYEAREDEFSVPETRRVQQMVFAREDDAKRAHAALSEGRAFAAVAKDMANMDAQAIELGTVTRRDMLPELADAVFALEKNKPSAPVKSPLGWHLFQVTDVKPGSKKTLDEARDEIRNTLAREKATDGMFQLANKLDDLLAGGGKLEEAAQQLNLKIQKIAAVDAEGRDPAGKAVANLPKGEFLSVAFATEQGADSQLTETGRDGFFVLRVESITPPALKPLAAVKSELIAAMKADQRAEAAKKAAEAFAASLKGGATPAAVAGKLGLTVVKTPPLLRRPEQDSKLPQQLISGLFDVKLRETVVARGQGGYYAAYLTDIVAADPAADKAGRDALAGTLREAVESDVFSQLALALRDEYGVNINRRSIDETFVGGPVQAPARRRR